MELNQLNILKLNIFLLAVLDSKLQTCLFNSNSLFHTRLPATTPLSRDSDAVFGHKKDLIVAYKGLSE